MCMRVVMHVIRFGHPSDIPSHVIYSVADDLHSFTSDKVTSMRRAREFVLQKNEFNGFYSWLRVFVRARKFHCGKCSCIVYRRRPANDVLRAHTLERNGCYRDVRTQQKAISSHKGCVWVRFTRNVNSEQRKQNIRCSQIFIRHVAHSKLADLRNKQKQNKRNFRIFPMESW